MRLILLSLLLLVFGMGSLYIYILSQLDSTHMWIILGISTVLSLGYLSLVRE